jgi:hypothetical protein
MRTVLKTLTLASVMGAACAQTLSNDKLEKVKSTLARSADKRCVLCFLFHVFRVGSER